MLSSALYHAQGSLLTHHGVYVSFLNAKVITLLSGMFTENVQCQLTIDPVYSVVHPLVKLPSVSINMLIIQAHRVLVLIG